MKTQAAKPNTMGMLMLKRSYQLTWCGKAHEIRDNAQNNRLVFAGTYKQCVAEAKRVGIWYS